ncbi:acyltransferase family protein [Ottowia thiooxydans]|uniref:acyltransferase family protein n=1 Tax=Ottowia thiooxydans TaxID=219182 RepID=UPI000415E056|nr:acyltransferase [Ottowia thiooxydans]
MNVPTAHEKPAHQANNFDAIRIMAALSVLVSHHFALLGQLEPSVLRINTLGGFAVLIFFTISGYLVTASWYNDPHLFRFAQRRVLRIFPAYIAVIVLTAYVLGASLSSLPLREYVQHDLTRAYLSNIWMGLSSTLPGVFEKNPLPATVNGSLWTIPIEIQCYVILALAGIIGILRSRIAWLSLIVVTLIWHQFSYGPDFHTNWKLKYEMIAYFLVGSAIFILQPHWTKRPSFYFIILAGAGLCIWHLGFRYLAFLIAVPYTIIYIGTRSTPILRQFGRWGDPSYGMYLIAFPIQQTLIHFLWPSVDSMGILAISIIITTILAYASWHGLEKIALKIKPLKPQEKNSPKEYELPKLLQRSSYRFALLFLLLGAFYIAWMIACWPGVLGQDSLAIMLEVETDRERQAGKPAFWYLYNLLLYGPWRLVEIPILVQTFVSVTVCARILNWMLGHRLYKSFWYCLFFVGLAPSVLFYSSALYSDGIYAMAMMGMLFEIWICYRTRRINLVSGCMLALTVPFALFARPNGFINAIALIALFFALPRLHRWKLLAVVLPWCIVAIFANSQYKYRTPIGSVFPLALYETVGFLEHRPMGLWEYNEPRISKKSAEALTSTGKSLEHISKFYDHYYWDPLIFFPEGPALLFLSKDAKKTIIQEFFKYNLWHNLPAFSASRVNIFLYSALASGGIPGPQSADYILSQTKSKSEQRYRDTRLHKTLMRWYDFTLKNRAIFWAPWLGLFLIVAATARAWRQRDRSSLVVCSVFVLQLTAVFFFSIAGEYRYLLSFFTAPLVLLPVYIYTKAGAKSPFDENSSASPT